MIIIIGIKHYFSRNYGVMANGTCSGTRLLGFNHSHTVKTRISCLVSPGPSFVKWNMPVNICVHVLSLSVISASLQPHGLWSTRLLCPWGFSKQEYWSELPWTSPGDLPDPGLELRSPALHVNSLPLEPPRKPKNTGLGSLFLPSSQPEPSGQVLLRGPPLCSLFCLPLSLLRSFVITLSLP